MTEEFDSAADQLQDEASAARAREAEDRSESGPEPELPTTLASGADDDDNPHAEFDDGAIEVRHSIIARQWLDGMMPHEVVHLLPHIFVEVVRRVTGSRWMANDPQASSYLQTMVLMALTRYRDETIHQYPTVLTVKASPPLQAIP